MTLSEQVLAIRGSVALSRHEHARYVVLRGHGAYDAADRLFTRELYIRDGQLSQGLLLNDDGTVFADCYLGSDDEDFFLIVEGPDRTLLDGYLRRHLEGIEDVEVLDESESYGILGIDGPYAWELMSLMVGPEVIGLPYLTFFRAEENLCCRVGKTGEYGYQIIAPRAEVAALWSRLQELGAELDVGEVGLEALDQCSLDNWFFNVRAEGCRELTPIELQLQWRVSYGKSFVGAEALARRRESGVTHRLTCLVSADPIEGDDPVSCGDAEIGLVAHAGYSPVREAWVGWALLQVAYAYPGIDPVRIGGRGGTGRTVSPPVVNNRSLYVNPQIHSFASRAEDEFPPI